MTRAPADVLVVNRLRVDLRREVERVRKIGVQERVVRRQLRRPAKARKRLFNLSADEQKACQVVVRVS